MLSDARNKHEATNELCTVLSEYRERFGGAIIPDPILPSPLGLIHTSTNTHLNGYELYLLFEQFGGPLNVYKECLSKNISWRELLGIRDYTDEEWDYVLNLPITY